MYSRNPIFTTPSPDLLRYRQFAAEFRANKPDASGNEIQLAYQLMRNAEIRAYDKAQKKAKRAK